MNYHNIKAISRIILTLSLLLLFQNPECYAQFGNLKNKLKKKDSSSSVEFDWERQKYLPAITLSSLLQNDGLRLELDGTLSISTLEISFLPKKDKDNEVVNYNPYNREDFLLKAILSSKESSEDLHTFFFTVNPVMRPISLMTCIHRPRDDMHSSTQVDNGSYTLTFYVGNKKVHVFEFQVEKKNNNDDYAAMNELFFLTGPWRKYGRLSFNEYVEKRPLYFEFFVLNNSTDIENEQRPNKQKEMTYTVELHKNGKIVAVSDHNSDGDIVPSIQHGRRGYWNIAGAQFQKYPPKRDRRGAMSEFFTNDSLTDGNYNIIVKAIGFEKEKVTEKYSFQVRGGKIVALPEANRSSFPKIDQLIEQGPKYTFVLKTK